MDAIVELTTAEIVVETEDVTVITTVAHIPEVIIETVVTSIKRVVKILSRGGTSISAVSPDNYFGKELALAGA